MRRPGILAPIVALSSALCLTAPAQAQFVQAIPGTTTADALAAAMRRLGADPRDLDALLTAGELSLRLGDSSGAASLFRRAEQLSPMNGRVKAGMASILVRAERPGEALRYFNQAEGYGFDPRRFAADRGLAFDLIGEQERAQRDYRLALKAQRDDETVRRYALSLGIAGKQGAALEQIDILLRNNDRGAWRARAFILAMNGDVAGAERIAATMIPGMARGLRPFFNRLSSLGATDRAFAVHFGEVRPTAERLADARLTPALPSLAAEARAAPVLAAVQPATTKPDRGGKGKRARKRRGNLNRIEIASAAPKVSVPSSPVFARAGASPSSSGRIAPSIAAATPTPATVRRLVANSVRAGSSTARVAGRARESAVPIQRNELLRAEMRPLATPRAAPSARTTTSRLPDPARSTIVAVVQSPPTVVGITSAGVTAGRISSPPIALSAIPGLKTSSIAAATPAADVPAWSLAAAAPAPAPGRGGPTAPAFASPASTALPVSSRMGEDSILARIVAGVAIPGYELGVGAAPVPAPKPEVATISLGSTPPLALAQEKPAPVDPVAPTTQEADARRALAEKKADEDRKRLAAKKAADAKALAAKNAQVAKALAAKRAADERAVAEKRASADAKKAERTDPARIWVQVAGGANKGDLPKAWAAAKAKAPALAGRQAWSTPLRATNRVVTGPFKTDADARAFVNKLAKQGVSAFTFTSVAGQKITKLAAK